MAALDDTKKYWRFAVGLRGFLRHTISEQEAREIVRRRFEERENNFLGVIERGVFGYPQSPYLPLLKNARVEFADIRGMVRGRGLEATLEALRAAGVYFTFEEFKGRQPIVRDGRVVPLDPVAFDNPLLDRYYQAQTGGTTGAPRRVRIDLNHLAARAPYYALAYRAYGVYELPTALWHGILPDATGVNHILCGLRIGKTPERWFSPLISNELTPLARSRLGTNAIVAVARASGRRVPWPERATVKETPVVARWAAEKIKAHGGCFVVASASRALRVALTAREMGLDISGTCFTGGGEPLTAAKMREIARAGARCFPTYFFSELGPAGMSCAAPFDSNDQHLFEDTVALIQHPEKVPGWNITVAAFHFTTLLPTAPKLLLNVQSDDYGIVEARSCGCPLEAAGFQRHVREIRSFHKLTGEGVTLIGSQMVRILEEILPAKFGGSPLDYQLVEEEDEQGLTRLNLLVSPKLQIDDERAVVAAIKDSLKADGINSQMTEALWSQAGVLRVKRSEPVVSARGKLMPLHLVRRSETSSE